MKRLLRPEEVPAAATGFNLVDLEREGQEILRRARERAAELLAEAEKQAEAVTEEARREGLEAGHDEGLKTGAEEGYKAGHEEGLAVAREATATLAEALGGLVAELGARRAALVKEAERDLLRLAVQIGARIARRELAVDGEAVVRAVAEAVSLAAERSSITVRVNPGDLEALRAGQPDLTARFADLKDMGIVGDESVERGGCRVLTEGGEVDMQVAAQLERIERLLVGGTESQEPAPPPPPPPPSAPPKAESAPGDGPEGRK